MRKQSWTPKLHVSPVFWKNLSVLTTFFQVDLGQPVLIEAKDDGGGGDNWTTGAIGRAKLQSDHHHQQTIIQFFTGRMPFLSPNQQCQSTDASTPVFWQND